MALEGNKGIGPRSVAAFAKFSANSYKHYTLFITALPAWVSVSRFYV